MVNYEYGFNGESSPFLTWQVGEARDVNVFSNSWYSIENRGQIDIASFAQGKVQKENILDVRRSDQFSYTNRGMIEQFRDKKFILDHLKRYTSNEEVNKLLREILKSGCLPPLSYNDIGSPALYHASKLIYKKEGFFGGEIDNLAVMKKDGVYGSRKRVTYLTRDFERVIAHAPKAAGSDILLLVFDTKKLLGLRTLFPDPESLVMTDEFMRNFVTPHGLPVGAITKAYHLFSHGESKRQPEANRAS